MVLKKYFEHWFKARSISLGSQNSELGLTSRTSWQRVRQKNEVDASTVSTSSVRSHDRGQCTVLSVQAAHKRRHAQLLLSVDEGRQPYWTASSGFVRVPPPFRRGIPTSKIWLPRCYVRHHTSGTQDVVLSPKKYVLDEWSPQSEYTVKEEHVV